MNDSLEYAKMIEIPSSSCEYVYKHKKHFFKKKELLNKVNKRLEMNDEKENDNLLNPDFENDNFKSPLDCSSCSDCNNSLKDKKTKKKNLSPEERKEKSEKNKNYFIKAQVVASIVLALAIVLTNIFWENSGMNNLFKSVFHLDKEEQVVDNRKPQDFSLTMPSTAKEGVSVDKGIIVVKGEYSLYPVAKGIVSAVEKQEDGRYKVTISHSDNFSSVVEGIDMVYFSKGDAVFQNVPLGYSSKESKVYLLSGGNILTDFVSENNTIVFEK